jgi:hypothetical protein
MSQPRETWTAILRPDENGIIRAHGMLTLRELFQHVSVVDLRLRFNQDMHLFTWHPPNGVTRERLFEAFDLLSDAERHALYCLPTHPMRRESESSNDNRSAARTRLTATVKRSRS